MSQQVSSLGRKFRETYQRSVGDAGPDQNEVKAAVRTLATAAEKLAQAVGAAVRDEEVRATMKSAATGFFEALGEAFSELGSELRRSNAPNVPAGEAGSADDLAADEPPAAPTTQTDDGPVGTPG